MSTVVSWAALVTSVLALVVSGAAHRTGAARMAARAALRVGAGLVALASPPEAVAVNSAHSTAVMIEPFDGPEGFAALLADSRRNAILIGPGAGVGAPTRALVEAALTGESDRPRSVVLDADALVSFAGDSAGLAALVVSASRSSARPASWRSPERTAASTSSAMGLGERSRYEGSTAWRRSAASASL